LTGRSQTQRIPFVKKRKDKKGNKNEVCREKSGSSVVWKERVI
jgi:hypothetical protein